MSFASYTPGQPVTPAQFRQNFPAFVDESRYTTTQIQMWLNEAYNSMDPNRWTTNLDTYAQLKAAHFLILFTQSQQAANRGASPGQSPGVVSSKGVGPASMSFDTANSVGQGGDYWNQTVYGQQYWRKARLIGMGGAQLI